MKRLRADWRREREWNRNLWTVKWQHVVAIICLRYERKKKCEWFAPQFIVHDSAKVVVVRALINEWVSFFVLCSISGGFLLLFSPTEHFERPQIINSRKVSARVNDAVPQRIKIKIVQNNFKSFLGMFILMVYIVNGHYNVWQRNYGGKMTHLTNCSIENMWDPEFRCWEFLFVSCKCVSAH